MRWVIAGIVVVALGLAAAVAVFTIAWAAGRPRRHTDRTGDPQ